MKKVRSVPEGFHTVTPYLVVDGADRLIEFIKNAFGGEETSMHRGEANRVMNATIKVGNSTIMVSDTMQDMEPETAMLYLYVDDVDSVYKQAIKAKGESIQAPKDEFYGDRASAVKDEWGNKWWIATQVEEVSKEELKRRMKVQEKEMAR